MAIRDGPIRGLNSSCIVVAVSCCISYRSIESISPVTALGYDQFSTQVVSKLFTTANRGVEKAWL